MRRQGGHSQMHMAEVVLKNLKKIYPNTEKKKKKGEPEKKNDLDRKSTRLNSSHPNPSRMPSSA